MKNQIKVKGQLKLYLQWPLFLSLLLFLACIVVGAIDPMAGIAMVGLERDGFWADWWSFPPSTPGCRSSF